MHMKICASALFVAMTIAAVAQKYPLPTAGQQAGIDKDAARHFGDAPVDPGPLATDLSPAITPAAIDAAARKVADWQLARSQPYFDRIWTWSVLYSGFIATSDQTGDAKYRDAMTAMSTKFDWAERSKLSNADDQSVGQTYLELYLRDGKKDSSMIAPTRENFDSVIGFPTLKPGDPKIPWWWCDALFMAPPAWARMYAATGDHKYIDYLNSNWQKTYETLWDKDEHMYARDATYIPKREANGKKIFWSRGEGWVMGGLVRTLQFLPKDDPRWAFYLQNLRELSARLAELQSKDGLWHAGLLDPDHYPLPEVSGSALIVYGMAWGVNEGVLDAATYRPIIVRAWAGMLQHVYADGRLGCIQQTGPEPAFYLPSASYTYGVGGFLLAASEMKRMALQHPVAAVNTDPGRSADFALPTPANAKLPTVFLVGDSTVRNGHGDGANNQMGWGEPFVSYFDTSKVNVVNRAIGGRSSRTYITEGHWARTLALIKPGDVVLFQFGHNDSGPLDDAARARGTIKGVGDESKEIDNPITQQHEVVHSFGWYMTEYVKEAKAKGATPIICSLVPRKTWKDGKIVRGADSYGGWAREVAEKEHVGFVDLNEITALKYDALGQEAVEPLFGDPNTHTTLAGAEMNAESVVSGLKALPKDPVAKDFSAKGKAVKAYVAK
jgi:unsaturated rhamnogalacturonyl hydrolase